MPKNKVFESWCFKALVIWSSVTESLLPQVLPIFLPFLNIPDNPNAAATATFSVVAPSSSSPLLLSSSSSYSRRSPRLAADETDDTDDTADCTGMVGQGVML